MNFLIGYGVAVLVVSILVLVISGFVADQMKEIPEWLSIVGQASVFGIGASTTGIVCLVVINILIPMTSQDDLWGQLASSTCLTLVVTGGGLVLVGGFGAVELLQRMAAARR